MLRRGLAGLAAWLVAFVAELSIKQYHTYLLLARHLRQVEGAVGMVLGGVDCLWVCHHLGWHSWAQTLGPDLCC